jgi:putative tricarboxylic transport membrane protein
MLAASGGSRRREEAEAMQLTDRVTGGALAVLGAAAAYGGSLLPAVPGQDVGPAAFPMLIGGGLVLCGALIALGIGRGFEAPDAGAEGVPRFAGLRALLPPALLVFYVAAADRLGFLPTAAAMVLAAALAFGARWRLALPLAVAAPLLVPLPAGLLTAPWAA